MDRRLAVITGASSGIGLELARQCAIHGFDLMICAEDYAIEDAAQDLGGDGIWVQAVREDLRTREGVELLAQAVEATGREVDVLILNPGVGVGGKFIHSDLISELDMIALGCSSIVHLAKRLVPEMVVRGEGRVMITGSTVGTSPHAAVHGATQAFAMAFGAALHRELIGTGVTVTVLQPTETDPQRFERADAEVARAGFAAMTAAQVASAHQPRIRKEK